VIARGIIGIALLILVTLVWPYFFWHIFRIIIKPKPEEREFGFIRIIAAVIAIIVAIVSGRILIAIWMSVLHRH
jgi:formate-dependent nitrite reductase membrane component NrfD